MLQGVFFFEGEVSRADMSALKAELLQLGIGQEKQGLGKDCQKRRCLFLFFPVGRKRQKRNCLSFVTDNVRPDKATAQISGSIRCLR